MPNFLALNAAHLPARIALVRHGETAWNAERRFQGRVDLPLNSVGLLQAQSAAVSLARGEWEIVVSSPLSRAKETASAITQFLQLDDAVVDDSLIERSFGVAEGIEMDEAARLWPDGSIPGSETLEEVAYRTALFLSRIGVTFKDQAVIVVCHVVIVREITKALTGKDPGFVANGSVTELLRGGGATMMDLLVR